MPWIKWQTEKKKEKAVSESIEQAGSIPQKANREGTRKTNAVAITERAWFSGAGKRESAIGERAPGRNSKILVGS